MTTVASPSFIQKETRPYAVKRVAEGVYRFLITDGGEDSDGDVIDPGGWANLRDFRGPVLWAHDHTSPAIATTVATARIGDAWFADAKFPPAGIHSLADTVRGLVEHGVVNAASVGFQPISWVPRDGGGLAYQTQTLLEWSICNVGINPRALQRAQAAGVDIGPVARAIARSMADVSAPAPTARDLIAAATAWHLGQAAEGEEGLVFEFAPEPEASAVSTNAAGEWVFNMDPHRLGALIVGRVNAVLDTKLTALTGRLPD